jgi:HD-like signal output (HDOD) protein
LIADNWQLPGLLGAAIRHHHDPGRAEDPYRPVAQITALANQLVNWFGIGSAGDIAAHPLFEGGAAQGEDLAGVDLAVLKTTVLKEIDNAQMFLSIAHQRG